MQLRRSILIAITKGKLNFYLKFPSSLQGFIRALRNQPSSVNNPENNFFINCGIFHRARFDEWFFFLNKSKT